LSDFDNFWLFWKALDIGNGLHSFAKKFLQIICKQPVKEICTFLVFLNNTSGYLKLFKSVCIFEMAWSRAFKKCIFLCFGQKNFEILLADSQSRV